MNNESAGRHLCMDDVEVIHAWLESGYGGCWTLPLETDDEQLEGVAVKVPGSRLGLGTYAVVMAGKFVNGGHFRTKRQLFIRLVDREEQADAKPTMFNEEKAYWAGPAVLSGMLSRDGLNTYELAVLHGYDGTLEQFLAQAGIELQDFMVTKAKLSREVQTQLDKGSEKAINPAGDYDAEAEYSVNEMVYDEVTNSSYVSKQSVNVGHAVTDTDWWMKVLDGNYVHTTIRAIMTAAQATLDEAKQDTIDATAAALAAKQATEQATAAANAVAAQKVADAQIGYYVCETAAGTATKATTTDTIGQNRFAVPAAGGAVKIKMEHANTSTDAVYLQFGTNTNTKRKLYYNGEDVSQSNTWDDGEVISVYLDPAANNGAGGYMASNAQGGSNKKIDAYLLGDLRTLSLGQTYVLNEAVKTIDKQFLRMNKEIAFMNLTDTIAEGDLKVYNNKTYQAQENIVAYAVGVEYEDGAYAFGCPAKLSLTIAREEGTYEDGTIDATIGGETNTITVLSADTPADIAGNIAASTWSDWYVSVDNSDVENIKVIAISKRAEVHVAGDIKIATNELGITGTAAAISSGSTTAIRKYNATDNVWISTDLDDYSADTSIWVQVTDVNALITYTVQDTVDNLSFGSGKTKLVVTTQSYYDNGGQQNYYYNTSSLNVGDLFTGQRKGNSARYCYKVQVFAGDIITFKLPGSAHQCLTGVDCIVTKKVHSDNISNGTVWNVSQDGYFFYNGTDQTGNPVAFTITRSKTNVSHSIEHLTPEDSLDSTDATKPLSANQGRILAERTQVVKELIPANASWATNKTTSCRITDLGGHRIEFYQSKSTSGNYLTLDLSGLENEKTYTLRMNYSSTMGNTSPLRRFSKRDTIADSYGGGNLIISDHREYEFTFKYYSNTPFIGWACNAFGDASTNNPWTFTIHSISIAETYTLEDIYEIASKAGCAENPDEEILRQLKYRTQAVSDGVATTYKNVTLLHFSDIHGDSSAANMIKAYYDKYSDYIDDIIDTGDDVVSVGNEDISFINNSGLGVALRTLGNHDAWYSAMNTWGDKNTLYNKFFKPFIANWGTIVQPNNAEADGLMYWYKDYDIAPVRIIGLDTNFYDGTMVGNPSQYTLDQITWLQGVLADAQNNGKTVVMLSHYIPAEEDTPSVTSHVQYNGTITTFSSMRKLNANNGTQLFYSGFMDAVKPYKDIVACWICGHKHDDILFHPASCEDILVSVINKAGRKSTSANIVADRSGEGQICANVVAIDTSNKLVKFFRIGLRKDKWMRPINILTYNYNTKEVITNY